MSVPHKLPQSVWTARARAFYLDPEATRREVSQWERTKCPSERVLLIEARLRTARDPRSKFGLREPAPAAVLAVLRCALAAAKVQPRREWFALHGWAILSTPGLSFVGGALPGLTH